VRRRFLCALLVLAGCGAGGPRPKPNAAGSPVARAEATHEYASPPSRPQPTSGAWPSPVAAVAAFASAYVNWDAQSVATDMRSLAHHSIGQARAAMQLAAAQTAGDYELQRGGIANQGVVEAVAPLRGHPDQYAVVTRELTTATATTAYQGLQPAWHVAVASVAETSRGRWVVSGWQPEG
jgi:hypothetical protein